MFPLFLLLVGLGLCGSGGQPGLLKLSVSVRMLGRYQRHLGSVPTQPIVDEWSGDCANPALPIPAAARVVVKVRPTSMGRKTARFSLCLVSISLSSPSL